MSANESNLKLKVKVDTTELDKLPGKLKGINAAAEGASGGEPVAAQKAKKVKASVEELSASQKFAAEVTKMLSEEQSQLASNVDASEIAQKALGAALQSFAGISAVAIGATLAIGSGVNQLRNEYKNLDISLAANSTSWSDYISSLIQGRDITNSFGLRQASLAGGIRLSSQELTEFSGTIERMKRVLGDNARDIIQGAAGGDEAMARQISVSFTRDMTAMQKRQAVIDRLRELNQQEVAAIRAGTDARAAAFNADSISGPDVGMGGGEAINAAAAGEAAAERVRQANEAANRALAEGTQVAWAGRQDIVDRGVMAYQNSMRAIEGSDQTRLENYLRGNGSLEASDEELNNRRIGWLQTLDSIRATSDMTQAQQDAVRQARHNAANQALNAENELRQRHNTVAGVRDRMRDEAFRRGIAAGMTVQQLERVSISNGQVRAQLELRIAELRQRLVGLTGQDAAAVRTQIAGIVTQLQSIGTGGQSRPLIALTEIRDMIRSIGRAMSDSGQADFIRSIETGTLTVEQQALRLGDLQRERVDAEQRNREALLQANAFAEQLDNARNTRDRQRFAELTRKANEELTRTRETLRTAVSAHDSAAQAIGRANREASDATLRAQREADQTAYDNRTRALQNQTRSSQDALSLNKTYLDAYIADLSGNASDYQRTIAGLFSPETMLREIQAAATNATDTLASEQARLAQMQSAQAAAPELAAQQQRVVDATRNQAAATRDAAQAQAELNERMREASFGGQFARAMTNNAKGMASMGEYAGGLAAKGLSTFSDAIWTSLEAIKSGEDVGAALNKMLTATLQSIGQEATVRALMETAAGIAALATPLTAPEAPGHFAAAGVYASVAVAAGVGYMALPSPPSKTEKEKEKTTADRDLLNAQRREQNIIINGSALMTKEELSKAARRIADYGKDL